MQTRRQSRVGSLYLPDPRGPAG